MENSNEYQVVKDEISRMEIELSKLSPLPLSSNGRDEKESRLTYACPLWKQYLLVTWRTIVEDWRTPGYIYSKLFGGFVVIIQWVFLFKADKTIQGLQNQMFAIFMSFIPFNTLLQQMLPFYVKQRDYLKLENPLLGLLVGLRLLLHK